MPNGTSRKTPGSEKPQTGINFKTRPMSEYKQSLKGIQKPRKSGRGRRDHSP